MDDDKSGSEDNAISIERKIMVFYLFNKFKLSSGQADPRRKGLVCVSIAAQTVRQSIFVDVCKLCVSKLLMFRTCYRLV
ncbi:hypothetical protein GCM10027342_41460 [Photobacterium alginatilyticum]